MERLLTLNCHESYVHLLGKLDFALDIVDGLPGRYTSRWDERMRPVPARGRLIQIEAALGQRYAAAIVHNISDLLLLRDLKLPKILVLHVNLKARLKEEPNSPPAPQLIDQLRSYLDLIRGAAVAVSETKRRSWGLECDVIRPSADPTEYQGYTGEIPKLLRVANQVLARRERFDWDSHERIVSGLPWQLLGHNPQIEGSRVPTDWEDTKAQYRSHRVYLHTAGRDLDDGYNMALVEAMMTGMPVLSTVTDESPIVDGINGFISDDIDHLRTRAKNLLEDPELARRLGENARRTALAEFPIERFTGDWQRAIEAARRRFAG